jgi:UDP-N-acetylmuramyl pentapeptide phosphotransferase/UDP-N-acetylglucosamine-1-phosphate transferase
MIYFLQWFLATVFMIVFFYVAAIISPSVASKITDGFDVIEDEPGWWIFIALGFLLWFISYPLIFTAALLAFSARGLRTAFEYIDKAHYNND